MEPPPHAAGTGRRAGRHHHARPLAAGAGRARGRATRRRPTTRSRTARSCACSAVQVRPGRRGPVHRQHPRSSPNRPASPVTVDNAGLGGPAPADRGRGQRRLRPRRRAGLAGGPAAVRRTSCSCSTDLATYLGEKYGGWFPVAEHYGKNAATGESVALPIGGGGAHDGLSPGAGVKEAGYDERAGRLPGLSRALQGAPAERPSGGASRSATRSATPAGPTGCSGATAPRDRRAARTSIINSPETIEALKYAKELYETFIPGTLSWLDPSNNKAFIAGELGLTSNGISIYYACKTSEDAATKALADDIQHAAFPIGPVGFPTPGRAGDQLDRVRLHALPERRPRVPPLHDRGGAVRGLAGRRASATGAIRCRPTTRTTVWTADPKHTPYHGRHAQRPAAELQRPAERGGGRGQGRLRHRSTCSRASAPASRRPRTPSPRPSAAPSAISGPSGRRRLSARLLFRGRGGAGARSACSSARSIAPVGRVKRAEQVVQHRASRTASAPRRCRGRRSPRCRSRPRLSAPAPVAIASGTAPSMVETTVITIGRKRSTEASSTASRTERPSIAQLVGELDDQDAVLGHQADQQDDADLAVDVERVAGQPQRQERAR